MDLEVGVLVSPTAVSVIDGDIVTTIRDSGGS
jgi:hypothetical protein